MRQKSLKSALWLDKGIGNPFRNMPGHFCRLLFHTKEVHCFVSTVDDSLHTQDNDLRYGLNRTQLIT